MPPGHDSPMGRTHGHQTEETACVGERSLNQEASFELFSELMFLWERDRNEDGFPFNQPVSFAGLDILGDKVKKSPMSSVHTGTYNRRLAC